MLIKNLALVVSLLLPVTTLGSILTPPVLPLVVRNPYLSTWLGNARNEPWQRWPMFYNGQEIELSVLAAVQTRDYNIVGYPLLGRPHDSLRSRPEFDLAFPEYLGAQYDASTTNLSYSIPHPERKSNPVHLTLSFLSPITPSSTLRQALPATYVTVYVDGDFDISVYIDLNGQWVSGDDEAEITSQFSQVPFDHQHVGLRTWSFRRKNELTFSEHFDRAEWGTLHFSAPADVRYQSGSSSHVRSTFEFHGTLLNIPCPDPRRLPAHEFVFAFSHWFHLNKTDSSALPGHESVTFTIAHTQDPSVQFASARGMTAMRPLWASYFSVEELLTFHYLDFPAASALAAKYSAQLAVDAYQSGANDYVDIVALSARQVMGAVTFVGTPEKPLIFMKEISSDGNTQTIDVLYPAFPFFLYSNPQWLAYMLEPLIEHMLSGQYPNKYAMHDLGTHFPNATGHPDGADEYMPVEECGDILIMGLAMVHAFQNQDVNAAGLFTSEDAGEDIVSRILYSDPANVFSLSVDHNGAVPYLDAPHSPQQARNKAKRWVERSYLLWQRWTGYLVEYSLRPENQLSTDDFAGRLGLQTNLALKGIIGIRAMSEMAKVVGNVVDAEFYGNISQTYVTKWVGYALSRDRTHTKLAYNWWGSWSTLYNLYADSLLCFRVPRQASDPVDPDARSPDTTVAGTSLTQQQQQQQRRRQKPIFLPDDGGNNGHPHHPHHPAPPQPSFVPTEIYTLQSKWYSQVHQRYGLPLDSRHLYTKTDWEFFAVAVASPAVRSTVLASVAHWVNETSTDRPFTDLHETEGTGGFPGITFFARPVVGGHFAFLALERACGGRAGQG